MKELTLPVICRNALTIVALENDFVNPSLAEASERAGVHFCPDVYNDNYLNVLFLLSKIGLLRHLGGLWCNHIKTALANSFFPLPFVFRFERFSVFNSNISCLLQPDSLILQRGVYDAIKASFVVAENTIVSAGWYHCTCGGDDTDLGSVSVSMGLDGLHPTSKNAVGLAPTAWSACYSCCGGSRNGMVHDKARPGE
jgi:hypothetical protein